MIILELNNFPLYILENEVVGPDIEPMAYFLDITTKGDHLTTRGECDNIPCGICPLSSTCKNGAHITIALTEYIHKNHPELLL